MLKNPKPGDVVHWTKDPRAGESLGIWLRAFGPGPFIVIEALRTPSVRVQNLDGSPTKEPMYAGCGYNQFGNSSLDPDPFLTAAHKAIHGEQI